MLKHGTTVRDLKDLLDNFDDSDIVYPFHQLFEGDVDKNIKELKGHIEEIYMITKEEDFLLGNAMKIKNSIIIF